MSFSEIQPRHVICLLGRSGAFSELCCAIQSAIDDFASEFAIDSEYSQDTPDDRMAASFDASWDRVCRGTWSERDEEAILKHGCVIYLLGPHMDTENAVSVSTNALRLIVHALDNGAVAAKGESAGVAHGVERWRQLGREAESVLKGETLARVCRLAFSKRPLLNGNFLCSVGFHLVGLPEVFVARSLSDDELVLSSLIDTVADEIYLHGVEVVLVRHEAILLPTGEYDEEEFKYNPYGGIYLSGDDKEGSQIH